MCGRYVLNADGKTIQQIFNLESVPTIEPRYNIAPSQPVMAITNEDPQNATHLQWGLIPSWSKDPKIGYKMINARSETAHEKPSFRAAFKRRRCIIPATGFYEWAKMDDGRKAPHLIYVGDHEVFAFAGLWEIWHSPDGEEIRTCTILTGEPNDKIKPLHHRMAVILHQDDYDTWLSPDELPTQVLMPLLRTYEAERMDAYEVSTRVNAPKHDGPENIVPVIPPPQQQSLL